MSAAGTLLETFLTLTLVCVVAFVLLYFARRAGVARAFGGLELVGQLPLEPRRAIYLVRLGEKVLVVGASEAGLSKLGELDANELPPKQPGPKSFRDMLTRVLSPSPHTSTSTSTSAPVATGAGSAADAASVDQ